MRPANQALAGELERLCALARQKLALLADFGRLTGELAVLAGGLRREGAGGEEGADQDPVEQVLPLLAKRQALMEGIAGLDRQAAGAGEGLRAALAAAGLGEEDLAGEPRWEELRRLRREMREILARARDVNEEAAAALAALRAETGARLQAARQGRQVLRSYAPGLRQWGGVFLDSRK